MFLGLEISVGCGAFAFTIARIFVVYSDCGNVKSMQYEAAF